jgi:hypothetical protein
MFLENSLIFFQSLELDSNNCCIWIEADCSDSASFFKQVSLLSVYLATEYASLFLLNHSNK